MRVSPYLALIAILYTQAGCVTGPGSVSTSPKTIVERSTESWRIRSVDNKAVSGQGRMLQILELTDSTGAVSSIASFEGKCMSLLVELTRKRGSVFLVKNLRESRQTCADNQDLLIKLAIMAVDSERRLNDKETVLSGNGHQLLLEREESFTPPLAVAM